MNNFEIDVAFQMHEGTKLPDGEYLVPNHNYDFSLRPFLFKKYLDDLETISLSLDKNPGEMPTLAAISTNPTTSSMERIPSVDTLTKLLFFSAGITKKINYPNYGSISFRAASCTGALYHIELYVVCGDLPGLAAGVYHFDPQNLVFTLLRRGDFRSVIQKASGDAAAVKHAPAVIVYTDIPLRNAVKYQAREYRHAFWDSGTILAHILALATAHDLPAKVVTGFVDDKVNTLLALETEDEFSLGMVPLGYTDKPADPAPILTPLTLETKPVLENDLSFPAIHHMHKASSLSTYNEVEAWRNQANYHSVTQPTGQEFPLKPIKMAEIPSEPLESVILRRGSTRKFSRKPISFQQLSTLLHWSLMKMQTDFRSTPELLLSTPYLIINNVDGIPPGSYVFHHHQQALYLLMEGDFRREAGYLALGQDLGADASVNIYFMVDLIPILEKLGNRGYRVAQLEPSISAGRMYLSAYAQGFGATGLTFSDDAVTKFFSPHAQGLSAMFLIAFGHKAMRSKH